MCVRWWEEGQGTSRWGNGVAGSEFSLGWRGLPSIHVRLDAHPAGHVAAITKVQSDGSDLRHSSECTVVLTNTTNSRRLLLLSACDHWKYMNGMFIGISMAAPP